MRKDMETNEETKYLNPTSKVEYAEFEEQPISEPQPEKAGWKKVAIGSAAGILLGAGAIYAVSGEEKQDVASTASSPTADKQPVKVGEVSDDMSFTDAFNSARAQVGAGGVFHWHGGIYSTYTADEWDNMTADSREEYAQAIKPEIRADEMENSYVAEAHATSHSQTADAKADVEPVSHASVQTAVHQQEDVEPAYMAASQSHQDTAAADDDVHVVAQGTVQGHAAAAVDLNGDGDADVAVIDVNDNNVLDDPDVVVDHQGNMATVGQLAEAAGQQPDDGIDYAMQHDGGLDPNMQQVAYGENPDVSPDMPDYMNDADMGTMV